MDEAAKVRRTYLLLTLLSTLAASFIWGINTLFLLDAGLNNTEAFAANAAFTAGEVLFEVPTGVVADTWGRRASYLLGSATLLVTTVLYLLMWKMRAPFFLWALASAALGLGFTFFSGATEAWLVDALNATGYKGTLDAVLSRGQVVTGVAMLVGTISGGYIAQVTNLGVPYLIRSAFLGLTFVMAALLMKDLGFTPSRGKGALAEVRVVLKASLDAGWRNPPVRWLMLAALFNGGVGIYAFYALQPFLLKLYGDPRAFGVAGLSAAIIAAAQILSGLIAPYVRKLFTRRTHLIMLAQVVTVGCLVAISRVQSFPAAIVIIVVWGFSFWIVSPVRQAYLNGIIPSAQRATVLSFDNLVTSAGGAVAQPALGRAADVHGYPFAYLLCAILEALAIPFVALARREKAPSDEISDS